MSRASHRILLITLVTMCVALHVNGQVPNVASGRIERIEKFKSQFVPERTVDVWLPERYSAKKKYAVVYMHDGQMLFDSTLTWNRQEWCVDEKVSKLMRDRKIKECIVVAIWNIPSLRYAEYFPQKIWLQINDTLRQLIHEKTMKSPPMADNYLQFIVSELKPSIDKKYSTRSDAGNTFIMGSSMGGLISLYALLEYPDVFGGAACLSTHTPIVMYDLIDENTERFAAIHFRKYVEAHLPEVNSKKIYFDTGDQTGDAFYKPYQDRLDEIFRKAGWSSQHWVSRVYPGESHSEKSWSRRIEDPLLFLLKN
jgi:enterochelin esterase-like enzyme